MTILVLSFFLFKGFEIILYKYDLYSKFEKYSAIKGNKFLYELSKCKFCMDHHLGILAMGVIVIIFGFNIAFVIFPIVIASINNLITKHERNYIKREEN